MGYEKYRNPDERCTYPFTPCGVGYCWSFAHHVDGTKAFEDIETICKGCEFWNPKAKREVKLTYPRCSICGSVIDDDPGFDLDGQEIDTCRTCREAWERTYGKREVKP